MAIAGAPIAGEPIASQSTSLTAMQAVGRAYGRATVTGSGTVASGNMTSYIGAKAAVIGIGDTGGLLKRVVVVPPEYRMVVVPPSS